MMRPSDEAQSECDEGSEVLVRFRAAARNALEALELAHKLLDTGAGSIERLGEVSRPVLGRCLERDHRADATFPRRPAVGLAVVSFVPHRSAGRDVRPEVEQDLELRAVARLTLREMDRQRPPVE